MGALARTPGTRRIPLAALVVALVALVTPTFGVFASVESAAWQASHGHIGAAAAVAHHSHPYDGDTRERSDASSSVVFTSSDDGSVASALVLSRAPFESTFLGGSAARSTALDETVAPIGATPKVPVPPPRA